MIPHREHQYGRTQAISSPTPVCTRAVDRVNLVTDRDTGRSRGFAFVEMSNTAEADRAIAGLNGADFEGRALNVNEARPKGQGGGGRGNGGGFGRQRREPRW